MGKKRTQEKKNDDTSKGTTNSPQEKTSITLKEPKWSLVTRLLLDILLICATIGLFFMTYRLAAETRRMAEETKHMGEATRKSTQAAEKSTQATEKMANIMHRDFVLRSTPVFQAYTPVIKMTDSNWELETKLKMVTETIAMNTRTSPIFQHRNGTYVPDKRSTVFGKDWRSPLDEIGMDYAFNTAGIITTPFPTKIKPEDVVSFFIVIRYEALFHKEEIYKYWGFAFEDNDRRDIEFMPDQVRDNHIREINEKNILGFQIPLNN